MSTHTIPVLKKAIAVLGEVAAGGETNAKAIARHTGASPTTTYRILQTFIAEDWIRTASGGRHELSLGLLPLLEPLQRHEVLAETARPILSRLADDTGLAAKLSIRQDDRAVTLLRAESPRETAVAVRVGAAFHLALGSSGAVLLTGMSPDARRTLIDRAPASCWKHQKRANVLARVTSCQRRGYCGDYGGYSPSVHALSAPVRARTGIVLGAITVVGFSQDFEGRRRETLARKLLSAASSCETDLRRQPTSADAG